MASFPRPIGATANVKELEYVAALHQTCMPTCRDNGTISSVDIVRCLRSRMGVGISHAAALQLVRDFGGGVMRQDVVGQLWQESYSAGRTTATAAAEAESSPETLVQKKRMHNAALEFQKILRRKKKQQHQSSHREQEENIHGDDDDEQQQQQKEEDDKDAIMEGEEPEEYLDLVQFLAALLMPTLARAGVEWRAQRGINADYQKEEATVDSQQQQQNHQHLLNADKSLRPKPENLFQTALSAMLYTLSHSYTATEDSSAANDASSPAPRNSSSSHLLARPELTPRVVKELLITYGELERAADEQLIAEMVAMASSSSGLLDEEALVRAMTADLGSYKVGSEDQETSLFYDVFGFDTFTELGTLSAERDQKKRQDARVVDKDSEQMQEEKNEENEDEAVEVADRPIAVEKEPNDEHTSNDIEKASTSNSVLDMFLPFKFIPFLPAIDLAIDAHSSVTIVIFIWAFFVLMAISYAALIQSIEELQPSCDTSSFGCQCFNTIISWFTFACILVGFGFVIIIPLSLGNSPRRRSPKWPLFSAICCAVFTWAPSLSVDEFERQSQEPFNDAETFVNSATWNSTQWTVRTVGNVLSILFVVQFVLGIIGPSRIRASPLLSRWFTPSSVQGMAKTKRAATRKINSILENAQSLHSPRISGKHSISARSTLRNHTAIEETMMNFVLHGHRTEPCGGFFWTWKMLLSGDLFEQEGVWLMTRLLVFQTVQLVLATYLTFALTQLIEESARAADDATASLNDNLPGWVYDIVPTGAQTRGALYPALAVSSTVMFILLMLYIPSYVNQTLMYRCGLTSSLKSPYFAQYRENVDLVYGNIGNAVFAMFGAGFLFFVAVGLVLFLFLWPFSRDLMLLIVAWGIGLGVTIVLKMFLTKACRTRFYKGFYRVRPRAANLSTLALECWFIGLGGGVLVGRFAQFVGAACFWVGRTDVPFLSADVSLLGYAFDYVPKNFVKDVLIHNAHHHPFLERIFTMYLLKLKDDTFCRPAGACWRQLFVVAWMPWLMKERVFLDKRLEAAIESYNQRRRELEEEQKQMNIGDKIVGEIQELQGGLSDMADQVTMIGAARATK